MQPYIVESLVKANFDWHSFVGSSYQTEYRAQNDVIAIDKYVSISGPPAANVTFRCVCG